MTEYSDVPKTNSLYYESQQIKIAIDYIDTGGSVTSFTVMPAPIVYTPGNPSTMTTPTMPIQIQTTPPNDPALLAVVRTELVAREQAIAVELSELGVEYTPPTRRA